MNGNAIATTWKAAVLVVAFAPSAVLSAEDAAATFRFESDVEAWKPLQVEFQSPDEAHAYWLALEKGTNAPTEIDACVDEIRLEPIERLSIFEQYRLTPTPEELEQIHGVHPRLYLDAERIAELRREVNDTHAPLWRELRELADRAVRRGPPAYREDDNWSGSEQLWQREVGNTMPVLAMAYVVSGDRKYVEAAQAWALASCGYGDDGASHEGVGYWEYGVEYLLKFMHLARQRLGVDLYRYDWWRNTARYPLYLSLPRGAWARSNSIVDIADCPRGHWYGPDYLLRGLAREYRDPQAQWLAHESDAADVTSPGAPWLNLVRYDPAVPVIPPDELPTLRHFDDMDIAMTFGTLSSAGDLPLPTGRDATSLTCARGIDRLLLIQRHPVEASHPYTYFYMDYRKGGGLCVYDRTSGDLAKIVDSTDGE
ncbi:MAG: hypothetical protein JJ992_30425, partial [Planctomycetes bacterium]|nr:hypothetical protein [Planctomycetota bacterium]